MLAASTSRGSSAFQPIRQGRLQRQHLVGQRPVGFLQRFPPLPERIENAPGAEHQVVDPALHVVAAGRLRREFGKLAVAGERDMQLGDAPPGLRHVAQIGDLLLALAGVHARRQQALLLDEAIEIGRAHGPEVALIGDEGVNDADGAVLVAFDQFDAAEQRRRIGESWRHR